MPRLTWSLSLVSCLSLVGVACGDSGGGSDSAADTSADSEGDSEDPSGTDSADPSGPSTGEPTTGEPTATDPTTGEPTATTGTDPSATDPSDPSDPSATDPSSTDPSTTGDPSTDSGTDSGTDPTTDSGTDTTDSGTGTTGVMSQYELDVQLSSEVLLTAEEDDALQVTCGVREDGVPLPGPFMATISVAPADEVVDNGGGNYSFTDFGVWTVSCELEIDGEMLAAEREVAVLNDAISPEIAQIAAGIGQARIGLFNMLAADGQEDQALIDAAAELEASFASFAPADFNLFDDALIPVAGGYPTAAELEALGIPAKADDAALAGALDDLVLALADLQATYAGIDPTMADEPEVLVLDGATADLQAAVAAVSALDFSTHAVIANRKKLADVSRDAIAPAMLDVAQWMHAYMKEQSGLYNKGPGLWIKDKGEMGQAPDEKPRFGFLGAMSGMVGNGSLQTQAMNQMYGDLFKAADKLINQVILLQAIDYFWDPADDTPEILTSYASNSQGYALEGYDTKFGGTGFHELPEFNQFIIIGDGWQETVDNAMSACDIKQGDSHPKKYKKLKGCVQQVLDLAESSIIDGIATDVPGQIDEIDVYIGPFPEACSNWVPVPIGVMPVNKNTGKGPIRHLNCIDNS